MSGSIGSESVVWLIAIAVFLVGVAIVLARFNLLPGRKRQGREELFEDAIGEGRLQVLESTSVDADRRLILVRCDEVEHLIMVGGPADVVVESDVRKSRSGAKPARPPAIEGHARPAGLNGRAEGPMTRSGEAAAAAFEASLRAEPKGPQATVPEERRAPEQKMPEARAEATPEEAPARPAALPRPALSAVPAPANQPPGRKEASPSPAGPENRASTSGGARAGDPGESRGRRPERSEPQIGGRREEPGIPERRATAGRDNGAAAPQPLSLPSAQLPWPEPDSVESEIVRALSIESSAPPPPPQQPQAIHNPAKPQVYAAASKPPSDPATTLGDLAERLEEALAREVQSASKTRGRVEPSLEAFSFDRPAPERTPPEAKPQPQAKERREPPKVVAPAPEPEVRRDRSPAPERQEEAPVISLNARRREPVDPLEDEMARLLGELTGDTNRR